MALPEPQGSLDKSVASAAYLGSCFHVADQGGKGHRERPSASSLCRLIASQFGCEITITTRGRRLRRAIPRAATKAWKQATWATTRHNGSGRDNARHYALPASAYPRSASFRVLPARLSRLLLRSRWLRVLARTISRRCAPRAPADVARRKNGTGISSFDAVN